MKFVGRSGQKWLPRLTIASALMLTLVVWAATLTSMVRASVIPTVTVATTCNPTGGTVSFTGGISGFVFSVFGPGSPYSFDAETSTNLSGDGGPLALGAGTYEYSYGLPPGVAIFEGYFTLTPCTPTPTPTPTPTFTPTPTSTPTPTPTPTPTSTPPTTSAATPTPKPTASVQHVTAPNTGAGGTPFLVGSLFLLLGGGLLTLIIGRHFITREEI